VYREFLIKEPDDLGDQAQTRFRLVLGDEKDWLCTVGLLPTDDPEARLYSADIAGEFMLAHLLIAIRCAMGISFDAVLEQRKSTPSKFNSTRRGPMAGAKRSRRTDAPELFLGNRSLVYWNARNFIALHTDGDRWCIRTAATTSHSIASNHAHTRSIHEEYGHLCSQRTGRLSGQEPEVLVLYQKRPQRRKLVASSESAAVAFDTTT
jgi:hypothetical protein